MTQSPTSTIYTESIQKSADICSNCLAVRQDRLERRAQKTSHHHVIGDIVYPRDTQTSRAHAAARECRNPPRYCHCGVFSPFHNRRDEEYEADDGSVHTPSIATETAIEYAKNLSATLTHLGYEHSTADLLEVVESLKSDSEWTGRDDAIFAKAVEEVVSKQATDTQTIPA